MHPNLSPGLNAVVHASEGKPGIDITTQQKGAMFEVETGNSKYTIVVVNPENQEVAMISNNPNIQGTDIWYLMGSGWGGSMMKVGFVAVGAQMRMRRLSGGLIETSSVKSFSQCNNPEEAERIVAEAESKRPRFMTEEEEQDYKAQFEKVTEEIIQKEFPSDKQESVREMVALFGNIPAKGTVMGVLCQAQKYGKLDEAQRLLKRDFEKHWYFQPSSVAGDPEFMPLNAHRWDALYKELGVPFPNQA